MPVSASFVFLEAVCFNGLMLINDLHDCSGTYGPQMVSHLYLLEVNISLIGKFLVHTSNDD